MDRSGYIELGFSSASWPSGVDQIKRSRLRIALSTDQVYVATLCWGLGGMVGTGLHSFHRSLHKTARKRQRTKQHDSIRPLGD